MRLVVNTKFYFSTICIIAGGLHMDHIGANLIKELKLKEKNLKFIGIGGQEMLK